MWGLFLFRRPWRGCAVMKLSFHHLMILQHTIVLLLLLLLLLVLVLHKWFFCA